MQKYFKILFLGVAVVLSGFAADSAQAIVTISNSAVTSDGALDVAPAAGSALTIGIGNTTGAIAIGSATSQNVSIADNNWSISTAGFGTLIGLGLKGSTSGIVTIQPAAAAGTWTLTLPTDDGTAGQFIQTDGAGVTTWATAGPGITSLNGLTAASQTFANDTNVTISSAISTHTIGWSGTLAVARGGTGSSTASGARTNLGAAASGANSDITSLSGLTAPLSEDQGGTGESTYANGQLLIGNTATTGLTKATLTAGAGITITNGPGSIIITNTSLGGASAPADATYITQTSNTSLTNEQNLDALATGLLKNTNGTGVLSIAAQGTDYYAPGGTDVVVADGGTGVSSLTAYAPIFGGTTSTGAVQSGTVGTAGQALLSNGPGLLPTFQTLPGGGDMLLAGIQTVTGAKTFNSTKMIYAGSTSGTTTLNAAAVAGSGTVTLPTSGTLFGTADTIPVANGGTGSTTASGARTNLGTAASGANSDITSLSGLTTPLSVAQGGTGDSTLGDAGVLIGNGTGTVQVTSAGTSGQVLTSNGAGVDPTFQAVPAGPTGANTQLSNLTSPTLVNQSLVPGPTTIGTIDLGSAVRPWQEIFIGGTSTLPAVNNFQITGASTAGTRVITLPNATGTLLSDAADVTVAQGGTGLSTLTANNVILGNGTSSPLFVAPGTSGNVLTSNGTTWTSATPTNSGTVTSVSVVSANGLAGTVATATTTPAITLSTTVTGLLKGNGTAISAATEGTDYYAPGGTDVAVADGGTGVSTFTDGGVLIGNGTGTVQATSVGTAGQALLSNGAGLDPTFQTLPGGGDMLLAAIQTVTGAKTFNSTKFILAGSTSGTTTLNAAATAGAGTVTLPTSGTLLSDAAAVTVAQGGTGVATLADAGVLVGNGTGTVNVTSAGTTGQVLTSNGAGVDPTFQTFGGGGANTALSNLASVAVNASLIPGAAGTLALGSGTLPWSDIFFAGTSGTPGTNNFKITGASTGGLRTITFPDASGTATLLGNASTGSGSVVLANTPTLVTPVLGAATATSIAFGNEALANYDEGTFTPTVDAGASTEPVYTTNTGIYTRIGRQVFVDIYLTGDGGAEGSGTGQMTISLPFTASSTHPTGRFYGGTAINGTGEPDLYGQIAPSATTVTLFRRETTTVVTVTVQGVNIVNFTAADQNNTTRSIRLKFEYFI